MLFRKKHPRSCSYCTKGTLVNENEVLCEKRGIVNPAHSCRSFRYDPCKRVPHKQKALDFEQFSKDDFSL